ncbi:hypothetical protein ABZ424_30330 [Streptomyces sp. NPDC005790]|uniref:hypothetical protein n=1 Tax=Streptomyces sp. NPDC005790 TaxID=3154777 RepID=UPI0033C3FAB8
MTTSTALAIVIDFVLHDVVGNVIAGLVLLAGTAGWKRISIRRQTRQAPPSIVEPDGPPPPDTHVS